MSVASPEAVSPLYPPGGEVIQCPASGACSPPQWPDESLLDQAEGAGVDLPPPLVQLLVPIVGSGVGLQSPLEADDLPRGGGGVRVEACSDPGEDRRTERRGLLHP